jgi:hypothetical protein
MLHECALEHAFYRYIFLLSIKIKFPLSAIKILRNGYAMFDLTRLPPRPQCKNECDSEQEEEAEENAEVQLQAMEETEASKSKSIDVGNAYPQSGREQCEVKVSGTIQYGVPVVFPRNTDLVALHSPATHRLSMIRDERQTS